MAKDQVYKTKEELKAGLTNAYKEFLKEYKEAGGEIIQFDDCLWELFDETNPAGFLYKGNSALANTWRFIAVNNDVADYGHERLQFGLLAAVVTTKVVLLLVVCNYVTKFLKRPTL